MQRMQRGCWVAEFRLETGRLVLRSWRAGDYAPFATMSSDPDVMQHLGGTIDQAASDAVIDHIRFEEEQTGHSFWAVERRNDGVLLGFCGLRRGGHARTPVVDELEIGWRLARHAWSNGYAREAADASLTWGWQNTAAARIAAWTVMANTRSWGLMLRLGMAHRLELDFDHPRFSKEHPLCRHVVYTIERPKALS